MRVSRSNPFRKNTHRHRAFEFLRDGEPHTLVDITNATWARLPSGVVAREPRWRRETASVLRHLRATFGLDVEYNVFLQTYRLSDSYVRKAAAVG